MPRATNSLVDFATVKIKEESPDCTAIRFGDSFLRPHGLIITFCLIDIIAYVILIFYIQIQVNNTLGERLASDANASEVIRRYFRQSNKGCCSLELYKLYYHSVFICSHFS